MRFVSLLANCSPASATLQLRPVRRNSQAERKRGQFTSWPQLAAGNGSADKELAEILEARRGVGNTVARDARRRRQR